VSFRQESANFSQALQRRSASTSFSMRSTHATGRADAVYNRLIIEYEAPGSLRLNQSHGRTAHSIQQAKDYVEGVAKRERHSKDRLLGIAFDGTFLIFVRWVENRWDVEPTLEWNEQAASRLLRSLVSLSSGRALIPENLVEDFGAQNIYSQRVTRALYHALEGHGDDLVDALFRQWKLFFSEASEYEVAAPQLRGKKELQQFARGMGLRPETTDPARLFFAIHTYFSFLAKAIAQLVLERYASGGLGTTPLTVLANLDGNSLRLELERLEGGGIFQTLGFTNLLEGDFFGWYLDAWSDEVKDALQLTLRRLSEYNPATIEEDPYAARDLLKKLYHYLMPREIRHDLGEYYTPDWLALRLLNQLGEDLYVMPEGETQRSVDFSKRLLDPACGSGTFLILAIRAIKEHARRQGLGEAEALEIILNGVVGIDLNPLAVLAARVGYLLAIAELVPYRRRPIVLPVYLADSIVTPTEGASLLEQGRTLDTAVAKFPVPTRADSAEAIGALADILHEYVEADFTADSFVERTRHELRIDEGSADEGILRTLFERTQELKQQGKDGIWARVLKNAFMPLFIGRFDYVAGNPPWVLWDNLPDLYRQRTAPLWQEYGLFVHRGIDTILGKGKKDISTLMTVVAIDRFLKPRGQLAFVITQSVFKSAGAGQGFRRFELPDGIPFRVKHVDDMSELRPFEGAANRTAVVVVQKGRQTTYPVPYTYWRKTAKGKGLSYDSSLQQVEEMTARLRLSAQPVNTDDVTSAWASARPGALRAIQRVLGGSDYEAHAGAYSGGTNSVYWLEVVAERPDGLLVVRNIVEGSKRPVESITTEIEPDLVFPLLRPRDLKRWQATPSAHILVTQDPKTRRGIDEAELQSQRPKTYAYLKRFEKALRDRRDRGTRGILDQGGAFYSMFSVSEYTFAPFKVVWPRIAKDIQAAVVSSEVIPQETITLIGVDSRTEANYICSLLNSLPFRFSALTYSQSGGKGFGSPHIIQNLRIPKFEADSATHSELAELGDKATQGADVQPEINAAAAEAWLITAKELRELTKGFDEMKTRQATDEVQDAKEGGAA